MQLGVVLRLFVSAVLGALLLYIVEIDSLFAVANRTQPEYLLLALIVALIDRVLMAYKWTVLLAAKRIQLRLVYALRLYLISTYIGLFLPATVGGDAFRIYAMAKNQFRVESVLASIVVERLLGFLAMFALVLISLIAAANISSAGIAEETSHVRWMAIFLFCATLVIIVASFNARLLQYATLRLGVLPGASRLLVKVNRFTDAYWSYREHKGVLLRFFLLSVLESGMPVLWTYLLALAFRIDVPILYFFVFVPIIVFLVRIPISIDGIGVQQGAYVYFFSLLGVSTADAFLLGVATHLVAFASVLPGGILYAISGLKVRELGRR